MNGMVYNHKKIERKWQKYWEVKKLYQASDTDERKKFYGLVEFPYPSGDGLHVGHPRSYTAMDIIARKRRMEGYNVLYPIGFDSFGLPTENYAIKTGRPPAEITKENIANFTRQLKSLGFSFDWSRAVTTSEPEYYKWTQWIFLQLFKRGLAYKKKQPINWCLSCKIGLANEEVVDGKCERCGGAVETRMKEQWMLAITKYADKLLAGLKNVDYIERAKVQQENWIGRSEGVQYRQRVKDTDLVLEAYDSVPQTFMAQTFAVIAPEHPELPALIAGTSQEKSVQEFVQNYLQRKRTGKLDLEKEMEGIFTGRYLDDPFGTGDLPIWVASFVVAEYGTGFVNSSAHDERDFVFAKKYGLPLRPVMFPADPVGTEKIRNLEYCYHHDPEAVLDAPEEFKGRKWGEAREEVIDYIVQKGWGERRVNYKLRDWVFSRQRYWGEPIPLVYCETCAQKKYKFIIVHGYKANSGTNWIPSLKSLLERNGHQVFAPDLPNPQNPSAEGWADFLLNKAEFTEDTVIIGVSFGAVVMQKLLPRLPKKIHKAIFIDGFVAPVFADKKRPPVEAGCDWKFNHSAGRKRVKEIVVLGDRTAGIIPRDQNEKLAAAYGTEVCWASPADVHFNGREEPAVFAQAVPSGWIPLPEKELPLKLPKVEKYQPTDTGESPLAAMAKWVKTKCPRCGGPARRETDTMPNWAGSSWYFLRYGDPENKKEFASLGKLKYWMPVDWYNGGMEHTTLHLLYSRFWNQFLFDCGFIPNPEPYQKRTSHGIILAEDGEKMSKSRGNVVNPDAIVQEFGADTLRLYEMFIGPFADAVPWSTDSIRGMRRFVEKIWRMQQSSVILPDVRRGGIHKNKRNWIPDQVRDDSANGANVLLHKTIKKVTEDIENMRFNTAISALMILLNKFQETGKVSQKFWETYLILLAPFAPHVAEELWSMLGHKKSIFLEVWPKYDAKLVIDAEVALVVQVNGKVRARLTVPADITQDAVVKLALADEQVKKYVTGALKKIIFVPGKLLSLVV